MTYLEARLYGFPITEVARMTGRHHETIGFWIRKKKLDARKINDVWYISPSELPKIRSWKKT